MTFRPASCRAEQLLGFRKRPPIRCRIVGPVTAPLKAGVCVGLVTIPGGALRIADYASGYADPTWAGVIEIWLLVLIPMGFIVAGSRGLVP